MKIIKVQYVDADTLTKQVTGILAARGKAEGRLESIVEIVPDGRSNQLIVIGSAAAIQDTKAIIKQFDVPLGLTTKAYSFEHVAANRIDSLMMDLLGEETSERLYRSSVDDEENLLIVTTTKDIHQQIEQIKKSRDIRPKRGRSPMRFYKVKNVPVRDLLQTIRSIEQQTSAVQLNQQEFATPILLNPRDGSFTIAEQPGVLPSNGPQTPSGPNQPPAEPGFELPPPPSYRGAESQPPLIEQDSSLPSVGAASLLGKARITADVHTNTLIVIAEPQVQRLYEELIEQLDQPLPQVLIESHIVIIDTTDDFSLGVEFSTGDRDGSRRTLTFSSFGLSEVDPVSGALSIIPGLGFNGTLVDPDVADVVVRALTDHSRSRVTSAPRILVNDNAEGQLSSVAEVPFTSINASDTVATTSFAGFAQAGTTITVTPRISDDDKLQLDFAITLNTFTS